MLLSKELSTPVFEMDIETCDGVKPHGFHLGTDRAIAMQIVREALCRDGVYSVALRFDRKLVKIYDWRDITNI